MQFPGEYRLSAPGTNCPTDQIILSESECERASNSLGLTYVGPPSRQTHRPAGCYSWGSLAQRNTVVDTSATLPEHFGIGRGICSRGRCA